MSTPAERLRRARIARGYPTAADAARAFGWPEVTYAAHENGTRGIRPDVAEKYARALGTTAAELLGIRGQVVESIDEVPVVASAAVGIWRDKVIDGNGSGTRQSSVAVPRIASGGSAMKFAVEVTDRSVDRILPKGSFAICTPVTDHGDSRIRIGSVLFIERERNGLVELSVRRVSDKTADHISVTCYSHDQRYSETIRIPAKVEDELVTIRGRVVGSYAPLDGALDHQ